MSKKIFSIAASCFMLLLVIAAPMSAQISPGTNERAVIPFDFIVRGKTLPAGTYLVQRINESSEALVIEDAKMHSRVMFETEPLQSLNAPRKDELVFHRYGDTYFLREIRIAGEKEGLEVATPRAERALQNEFAKNNVKGAETVAVLLQ